MDQWHDQGAGGYFAGGMETPSGAGRSKPAARQQFLCPVTIRQLLEAPEDGLKVGNLTATMVTLAGVVLNVNTSSTNVQFTISDDTGVIECLDWLESEDSGDVKKRESLMEGNYYQVFGCLKSPQGKRRIMVFKVVPIDKYTKLLAFMTEVLSFSRYATKMNSGALPMDTSSAFPQSSAVSTFGNADKSATPKLSGPQKEILDAIKAVDSQVGWDKKDPGLRRKYPQQQIDNIIDYLVGEGYIYSTIDEDHYNHT